MKYIVTLGDERVEVVLGPDGITVDGRAVEAKLDEVEGTPERVLTVDGEVFRVEVRGSEGRGRYALWVEGYAVETEALDERTRAIRDLTAASGAATGPRPLVAPMPGLVVRVSVQPGDVVEAGQGLVVMEAMKMENELRSTSAGTVKKVLAQPGTAVEKGAVLVELE